MLCYTEVPHPHAVIVIKNVRALFSSFLPHCEVVLQYFHCKRSLPPPPLVGWHHIRVLSLPFSEPLSWLREPSKLLSSTRDLTMSPHWEKGKEKLYFMLFQI